MSPELEQEFRDELIRHMERTANALDAGNRRMDELAERAEQTGAALARIETRLDHVQTIDGCAASIKACAAEREARRIKWPTSARGWIALALAALTLAAVARGMFSNSADLKQLQQQLDTLAEITQKIESQPAGAQEIE